MNILSMFYFYKRSSKVKDLLNLNVYTKKVANFTKSLLYYCVKF
jgi:hypothetical protein